MLKSRVRLWAFAALTLATTTAHAAEICGNGIDDDSNGLVDEGCFPALTTGQCENPLSCAETGSVSPKTGSLRYELPPDVAPKVPYGPSISFRRYYESQYAPGGAPPAYRKALGDRWGHSYASWLDKTPLTAVVLHLPRGQDARFGYTSTSGGFDNYNTFQKGFHFQFLRQRTTSPFDYQLRTLTGETLVYDSSGKLTEIWDTLATPNKVLLAYDGAGMLSTVTDASGKRRLLFGYTSSQLTSVAFQINTGSWATQHTTSYAYASGNLSTVTIGGQLAQTNNYTSNYLTSIVDGNSKTLISFAYDSATAGKAVRVDTPRGVIGYDFAPSRTECSGSGKTALFFHKANATSCTTDTDCGTGNLCGGKTGAGATGQCFRAARCLTTSSTIGGVSDDVVTAVSSFAGNAETCDGACLDALQYTWSSTLDLTQVQDPSSNWTVSAFNANGLPETIQYGVDNTLLKNTRTLFLHYDNASFPGKVTESRRKSDLDVNGTACAWGTATGCARTIYTYNADGLLSQTEQIGTTFDGTGSNTGYDYVTGYSYNSKGQLTQIDGPLVGSDDVTQFEFWSAPSDPLKDGFLQNFKRKKDATNFLTQSSLTFDFWGNPTSLLDVDGTVSCQTFDSARGYLTQRREQMAGQTDCTANAADLVTSYARDSALRLTQMTRPDGSCVLYDYDTRGRLSRTRRLDDCNTASTGDTEEYTYSDEGLLIKTEDKDPAGTVTRRQELTYFDSRRLEKMINPVNTAKWTGLTWDARGLLDTMTVLDGATTLSQTQWVRDTEGRIKSENRLRTTGVFDVWNVLFDWLGDQKEVTDGTSKTTASTRDDLGRMVKLQPADSFGPNLRLFDAANRLVTMKEAYGTAGEAHHSFTFDNLGRPLVADYAGSCSGINNPDITRIYDSLSGAPSCPAGTSCTNLGGRLAYVKVKLMCQSSLADQTLEQETWYGYDAAGRLTSEYIKDDNGRTAAHVYSWTKNGALQQTTLPSGAVLGATYGSTASNSDTDRIRALWRTTTGTPIIDGISYKPFGPVNMYNQKNSPGTGTLRTRIVYNLAYRQTLNTVEKTDGTTTQSSVTLTEDNKGRITARDYFPSDPTIAGRYDSYYTYDLQDRVICEASASGSCSRTAPTLKYNHDMVPPFTAAGDWKRFLHPIPGSTGVDHVITLANHFVATVDQNTGTPALGATSFGTTYFYDRAADDNFATLSHDRRDYTYDGRRNLSNVRGEYFTGGAWHFYDVASAFDAKNRRVFKSFYDETTAKTATWFFYYDALDRLAEVRYTPDSSVATTYSVIQLAWLGQKLVAYWQTDFPGSVTSKRYVSTDEMNRPVDMMTWPASGAAARVWTINPDAWGNDTVLVGSGVFQPILFAGQYKDDETVAWQNDGVTRHRPGVVLNGFRTYDPWVGAYLQVDPMVDSTWSSYSYVYSSPVENSDSDGRRTNFSIGIGFDRLSWGWDPCWNNTDTEGLSSCWSGDNPWEPHFGNFPHFGDGPGGHTCADVRGDNFSECPGSWCCVNGGMWCDNNTPMNCPSNDPDCITRSQCYIYLNEGDGLCSNGCASLQGYDLENLPGGEETCWRCTPPAGHGDPFKPHGKLKWNSTH